MPLQCKKVKWLSRDYRLIKSLYKKVFPKEERAPLWFLVWRAKHPAIDMMAFYDEATFVGFTYLITDNDITFILYLAITPSHQSKGYGKTILEHIKSLKPKHRIMLNIESPEEKASNTVKRKKRKQFYLKNRFRDTHSTIVENDTTFEILSLEGQPIKEQEYDALMRFFMTPILFKLLYKKIKTDASFKT